jgi:acetyltransferase-like isoleucine patch superfamily enzyme
MDTRAGRIFDMPWRVTNEVMRRLAWPFVRLCFALHGVRWGRGWRVFGAPRIQRHRGSQIVIGDGFQLRSWARSNPLITQRAVLSTRTAHAQIHIGRDCGFSGAVLVANQSIEIGDRVLLGANVFVLDNDFHPLDPEHRRTNPTDAASQPIVIEADVFVGMNSVILKGIRIGSGSVVAANSVVTRDVAPNTLVAGNPAKMVRRVVGEERKQLVRVEGAVCES